MSAPAPPLQIALFATASRFACRAFQELLAAHWRVVAVVLFRPKPRGLRDTLRALAPRRLLPLERHARELRVPIIAVTDRNGAEVAERLRSLRPDLICIATFPRLIPPEIAGLAPLGCINLHPSLLPRHRGPLPLFWTYYADDRSTGVTVHHASQTFDAGDIILQQRFPLPRAYPHAALNEDVARRGAALLRSAAEALARGRAPRVAQDESAATYAPRVSVGASMVRFDAWDVERVWHFLAGLSPRFREPLTDSAGRAVLYQAVTGFERGACCAPGSVEAIGSGWRLHCRGGVVLLDGRAEPSRARMQYSLAEESHP
jgi:methionyl-tRNA formyltransferase